MKSILIIGAGRSATSLIAYLLDQAGKYNWQVVVADQNFNLAREKVGGHPKGSAITLDINNLIQRRKLIHDADIVISMLPPELHDLVAHECLDLNSHLLTASYLSPEMVKMHKKAEDRGLLFLVEMGLDPGIDHMSAMEMINDIKDSQGEIVSFKSFTGGLISKENDDNPWHYKITWNPRNVVLAGRQTARYRQDGLIKYLPYQQLFQNAGIVRINDHGQFEMYPNRDSLTYDTVYGLQNIPTIIRGTLRHPGFCEGWAAMVRLGLTDNDLMIEKGAFTNYRELLHAFLPGGEENIDQKIKTRIGNCSNQVIEQITWLFDTTPVPVKDASMATLLEDLIVEKWSLKAEDKDMVVMHHEVEYRQDQINWRRSASMIKHGSDRLKTAMTDLVGLPLGICTKLLLNGELQVRGVQLPLLREIYQPVLKELSELGILFRDKKEII